MMTSSRPRGEVGGSFASRRGHASQLSISDPSHHVTEAIGTLYGDEDDHPHSPLSPSDNSRPLSFIGGSPFHEQLTRIPIRDENLAPDQRPGSLLRPDNEPATGTAFVNGQNDDHRGQPAPTTAPSGRKGSLETTPKSPLSPTLSLRDMQADQSGQPFPLTNIDNPNDIAQELSNLQALRRLSMDVGNNKDPDLPPMSMMAMPAIAPSGNDDENDPSRLLWVPARVHPELAPTEFKSFLENRVQSIRRRSGDSFIPPDTEIVPGESNSGSLERKKSKLSRQIDNSGGRGVLGYVDDRLERQRSQGSRHARELSIDELVKDPTKAVQKLTQESQVTPTGPESSADDMPILPMAPGMGLRRSTRTTYRKGGSLRAGDRLPFSRRLHRQQENEPTDTNTLPTLDAPKGHGLMRVQSEPLSENYSRPSRSVRRQRKFSQESLGAAETFDGSAPESSDPASSPAPNTETLQDSLSIRTASTTSASLGTAIETSIPEEPSDRQDDRGLGPFPQRSSSQKTSPVSPVSTNALESEFGSDDQAQRSNRRAASRQTVPQSSPQQYTSRSSYPQGQSLNDNLTAHPSPLPGGGATRTDSLTFIPTLAPEERKPDKKSKKDKDDDAASVSSKSSVSSWKWFNRTEDKKKKEEESRRSKAKAATEKAQDNARLDVIQTSIDKSSTKHRESLVLDRDSIDSKLHEERRKEGHRKSDSKREKDGNIFSSIFGGSKKKEEKEKHTKKVQHLKVPEEPVYKPQVPDVDYHWTRFPLLEERAIYRMAHIKLANPRRSLLSQVLLSNFMYSYLAIVQAMHPQMNVPVSPQQKRLEEEARRKQQEQEYVAQQQMQMQMQMQEEQDAQDAMDHYNFDYSRAAVQYAEAGHDGEVDYVDDAQIYEDEHGRDHQDGYGYESSDAYGQGAKEYYQYHDTGDDRHHDRREDMW